MLFSSPMPFAEAVKRLVTRKLMPTNMSSAQLERIGNEIKRQSVFSAKVEQEAILQRIKEDVQTIISPRTEIDEQGNPRTVGLTPKEARDRLLEAAKAAGYKAPAGGEGTIQDVTTEGRRRLIVEMNLKMAEGRGAFERDNDPDVLLAEPAREFYREEARMEPRDWPVRWNIAKRVAGDHTATDSSSGRMVAKASSRIWGWLSRFKEPWPPFDFNSGMGVRNVSRAEAVKLGVVKPDEIVGPYLLPPSLR